MLSSPWVASCILGMDTEKAPKRRTFAEVAQLDPDEPINSYDAATYLSYTNRVSFMRAVRNYRIPCIRLNERRIRFTRRMLDEWKAGRVTGRGAR